MSSPRIDKAVSASYDKNPKQAAETFREWSRTNYLDFVKALEKITLDDPAYEKKFIAAAEPFTDFNNVLSYKVESDITHSSHPVDAIKYWNETLKHSLQLHDYETVSGIYNTLQRLGKDYQALVNKEAGNTLMEVKSLMSDGGSIPLRVYFNPVTKDKISYAMVSDSFSKAKNSELKKLTKSWLKKMANLQAKGQVQEANDIFKVLVHSAWAGFKPVEAQVSLFSQKNADLRQALEQSYTQLSQSANRNTNQPHEGSASIPTIMTLTKKAALGDGIEPPNQKEYPQEYQNAIESIQDNRKELAASAERLGNFLRDDVNHKASREPLANQNLEQAFLKNYKDLKSYHGEHKRKVISVIATIRMQDSLKAEYGKHINKVSEKASRRKSGVSTDDSNVGVTSSVKDKVKYATLKGRALLNENALKNWKKIATKGQKASVNKALLSEGVLKILSGDKSPQEKVVALENFIKDKSAVKTKGKGFSNDFVNLWDAYPTLANKVQNILTVLKEFSKSNEVFTQPIDDSPLSMMPTSFQVQAEAMALDLTDSNLDTSTSTPRDLSGESATTENNTNVRARRETIADTSPAASLKGLFAKENEANNNLFSDNKSERKSKAVPQLKPTDSQKTLPGRKPSTVSLSPRSPRIRDLKERFESLAAKQSSENLITKGPSSLGTSRNKAQNTGQNGPATVGANQLKVPKINLKHIQNAQGNANSARSGGMSARSEDSVNQSPSSESASIGRSAIPKDIVKKKSAFFDVPGSQPSTVDINTNDVKSPRKK